MKHFFIILFFFFAVFSIAPRRCLAQHALKAKTAIASDSSNVCFPLKKDDVYYYFNYIIDLSDAKVIDRFQPLFQKYNYKFTGYVWESILKQILADAGNHLAGNVFLKRDSKMVGFNIIQGDMMKEFSAYMCKVFSDNGKIFEVYMKTAERDKVNNY